MTPAAEQMVLRIGRSRRVIAYIVSAHLTAIAVLSAISVPLPVRMICLLLLLSSGWLSWYKFLSRNNPRRIVGARLLADGGWMLYQADGRRLQAMLSADSLLLSSLLILNFRIGRWHRRSLILPGDNLDAAIQRRLRVRLRALAYSPSAESGS